MVLSLLEVWWEPQLIHPKVKSYQMNFCLCEWFVLGVKGAEPETEYRGMEWVPIAIMIWTTYGRLAVLTSAEYIGLNFSLDKADLTPGTLQTLEPVMVSQTLCVLGLEGILQRKGEVLADAYGLVLLGVCTNSILLAFDSNPSMISRDLLMNEHSLISLYNIERRSGSKDAKILCGTAVPIETIVEIRASARFQ
ncbi:hypothetical protein VNO77_39069 [Canavalia gladiata]|uniref:Uncharacterized protein n=1 Tax=Canavalia gladiata TaxID=3824 RepID=A0AAN9KCZ5_CANGL